MSRFRGSFAQFVSFLGPVALAVIVSTAPSVRAQCTQWGTDLASPAFDGGFEAAIVFDDGTGPALYVAGSFTHAPDGTARRGVLRRSGTNWTPVGTLPSGDVRGFTVFDDGTGARLHVHGGFDFVGQGHRGAVYAWDGVQWNRLGTSFPQSNPGFGEVSEISALVVYDPGTGPRLHAAGYYPGGTWRWNGSTWDVFGGPVSNGPFDDASYVHAMVVHDDGSGPALFIAGQFDRGGTCLSPGCLRNVARSTGGPWESAGNLGGIVDERVTGLCSASTSAGPILFASGTLPNGSRVGRWNGSGWTPFAQDLTTTPRLQSFSASFGLPSGVCFTGNFTHIGGATLPYRALWDGTAWQSFGDTPRAPGAMIHTAWDDGTAQGVRLFAANNRGFLEVLDGNTWTTLDSGLGAAQSIDGIAAARNSSGERELFVVGNLCAAIGGWGVDRAARFDGRAWAPETIPPSTQLGQLVALDLGAGEEMYLTATFAPWTPSMMQIVKRTSSGWVPLPLVPGQGPAPIPALAVYDDGQGPKLYAAGTNGLWRLDGNSWTNVFAASSGSIRALCAFDDGSGPSLFVGGVFTSLAGVACGGIARFDPQGVHALGTGTNAGGSVSALRPYDDGSGRKLFVGGKFTTMDGASCSGLARWDGVSWSAVGGGVQGLSAEVTQLAVHEDANGSRLVVAGRFASVGGFTAGQLAAWDGAQWDTLSGGVDDGTGLPNNTNLVRALVPFDAGDGHGSQLFVGGAFRRAGGLPSSFVARRVHCDGDASTLCYGDGTSAACPCGNASAPGSRAGCLNSLGLGGTLRVSGHASLTHDTLVLEGGGMGNSIGLYFQGGNSILGGAGVAFGDGLRCLAGPYVRFPAQASVNGVSRYPGPTNPSVSTIGQVLVPGTHRYQIWYRDSAAFCTPSTFTYTNALEIAWGP